MILNKNFQEFTLKIRNMLFYKMLMWLKITRLFKVSIIILINIDISIKNYMALNRYLPSLKLKKKKFLKENSPNSVTVHVVSNNPIN